GRISLMVGLSAALLAMLIGGTIGILAGYLGGWIDAALMRLTDGVISLPLLPLMIVLAAADPAKLGLDFLGSGGPYDSVWRIVLVIALFGWTTVARLARAATFTVREMDYVAAARGLGTSNRVILLRHIAPNIASPIVVATALSVGQIILAESALSFLGVGVQPPTPSWGAMLTNAQTLIWTAPWLAIWPGVFIFLTVIGFNLVADGLQDALDPRS
ncbi:MAG: ABC transporter permease, partial [Pseudomonadota bacterium]